MVGIELVAVDNPRCLLFLFPLLIPSLTLPANCFGQISCASAAWAQCPGVDRTRAGTGKLTPWLLLPPRTDDLDSVLASRS